jgi:hypothetical protein
MELAQNLTSLNFLPTPPRPDTDGGPHLCSTFSKANATVVMRLSGAGTITSGLLSDTDTLDSWYSSTTSATSKHHCS